MLRRCLAEKAAASEHFYCLAIELEALIELQRGRLPETDQDGALIDTSYQTFFAGRILGLVEGLASSKDINHIRATLMTLRKICNVVRDNTWTAPLGAAIDTAKSTCEHHGKGAQQAAMTRAQVLGGRGDEDLEEALGQLW